MAAYHCAVKCFKFLLIQDADLSIVDDHNATLADFAVAGGDVHILSLLDERRVSFFGTLVLAAERGNFNAFLWLLATQLEHIGRKVFLAAIKSRNWKLKSFVIQNVECKIEVRELLELKADLSCRIAEGYDDTSSDAESSD